MKFTLYVFNVAPALTIASVADTLNDDPDAVILVDPCFNVTVPVYPVFNVAFAHTGVPASITVVVVNSVSPLAVVVSYFVVNVVPSPCVLDIEYAFIFALLLDIFPAESCTYT